MRTSTRRRANLVNLSTPLGLALARLGGATVSPGRHDLRLATGHRLPLVHPGAITVGDVVLLRAPLAQVLEHDARDPRLLDHEARHAQQYVWCLGPLMLPLYGAEAGWSWLRTGDWWSRNAFERRAVLADGGYVDRGTWRSRRRAQAGRGPAAGSAEPGGTTASTPMPASRAR
jgi:hypothetical protein